MKALDKDNWDRNDLVEKYADYVFPYINLGAEVDVTNLYRFVKANDLSFYCAMMHTALRVALEIPNFLYRLVDGEPMICERLNPEFTHLQAGSDHFLIVTGTYQEDLVSFCRETAERMRRAAEEHLDIKIGHTDSQEILYISCIPWVKYTHFVRTFDHAATDNIPRVSWGKFEWDEKGRLKMPLSVQVHHALVDGYHVGIYMQRVQELLDKF